MRNFSSIIFTSFNSANGFLNILVMVNNRTNKTVLYIFLFSIFNKTEILTLSSEKAFLFESRYIYKGSLLS